MELKIILGLIAAGLAFVSSYFYIKDIFLGNTKPHLYTWLIWSIVTVIAFLGQLKTGGGPGSWATGVSAIITIAVTIFCFFGSYSNKDITNFDKICLFFALCAILPWILVNSILWSVIFASFIDIIGFLPTMRKTWNAPKSESLGSMFVDSIKHTLSITSLSTYSLTTWLYPAAVLVTKLVIILEIIFLRYVKAKNPS
jgi:hypothetical protein